MSDIFSGLSPEAYDRVYSNWYLVKRISKYLRSRLWHVIIAAFLIVLVSILTSVFPVLIAKSIDRFIADDIRRSVWLLGLLILGSVLCSWLLNVVRQIMTSRMIGDIVYQLQIETLSAAIAKDMLFFDQNAVGKIVSRITSDTEAFSTVLTLTLNFISHAFLIISICIIMFSININLTIATLSIAPVIIVAALAFRRIGREATQHTRRVMASVNANVYESMSGISIAKNFGQEDKLYSDFDNLNELSYRVYTRQGLIYSAITPILNVLSGFGTLIVLYYGGMIFMSGDISAGNWYLYIQALSLLWTPLTQVAAFWSLLQLGFAASERIFAFIDSDDSIKQHGEKTFNRLQGKIELQKVGFWYEASNQVLSDFSIAIAPGESVAIVGHTGAGKSSIIKLIARFYEFQNGKILIDGEDIRMLDLKKYRNHLGIVPQQPFLFSGKVKDNIGYVMPGASEDQIWNAARQVGGGDWIDSLPDGLDTIIKEGGRGLSMGQRQMIALARVFLKKPSIVIFDEATASIDPLAESQIQDSLDDLFRRRTVIIIAHRLSTIKNADRIITIEQGNIIEQGSYEELMERNGHFATLYNTYYKHQAMEEGDLI
jgi:ATP-binding cassette, subfamily B, bacterial